MAEELKDKLVERIAKRRAEQEAKDRSALGAAAPVAPVEGVKQEPPTIPAQILQAQPEFLSETTPTTKPKAPPTPEATEAINAMASGANSLAVARLLSAAIGQGMDRKELCEHIDKSAGWLSKKLGLLTAPKEVQRLIEAGELSESDYHDNRQNVKAGIKGRGETVQYQKMPTITITIEAAKALASILKHLAEQHGAAPIRLDAKSDKKALTSILNMRAAELRGMLK